MTIRTTFMSSGRSPGITVNPLAVCSASPEFQNWKCVSFTPQLEVCPGRLSPLVLFWGECLQQYPLLFQHRLLSRLPASKISACQVPLINEMFSAQPSSSGEPGQPARGAEHSSPHTEDSGWISYKILPSSCSNWYPSLLHYPEQDLITLYNSKKKEKKKNSVKKSEIKWLHLKSSEPQINKGLWKDGTCLCTLFLSHSKPGIST